MEIVGHNAEQMNADILAEFGTFENFEKWYLSLNFRRGKKYFVPSGRFFLYSQ